MTDGLDQALSQVVFNLLAADNISPALPIYDGQVPNPDPGPPYVLIYTLIDRPSEDLDNAIDNQSSVWLARWYCHCVGATGSAARAVAQRVRTQLLDAHPTVTGLSCGMVRLEETQTPIRDEKTGTLVMDLVEVYRLRATTN